MMSDARSKLLLRVVAGANAGAELALHDGTWLVGSGADADIAFAEAALLPAHLRLTVASGKASAEALAPGVTLDGADLPTDRLTVVAPGAALGVGATLFGVGPAGGPWPGAVRPPPPVQAEPQPVATPEIVAAPTPAPAPLSPRRRPWRLMTAGAVLLVVLAGAMIASLMHSASPPPAPRTGDPFAAAEATVRARGLEGWVTLTRAGNQIRVAGQVHQAADTSAIAAAVQQEGGEADMQVATDATIQEMGRTVMAGFGIDAKLALPAPGAGVLTGFSPDSGRVEMAIRRLRTDVPALRTIEDGIDTPDRARAGLETAARARGLSLRFANTPRAVQVSGAPGAAGMPVWTELAAAFRAAHGDRIGLEAQLTPVSPTVPAASPRGVVLGPNAALVTEDGRRLKVGDMLDGAGRIVAIEERRVRVRAGASEMDVPYARKPAWIMEEK